jgi:multiple sugar transport system permease protein
VQPADIGKPAELIRVNPEGRRRLLRRPSRETRWAAAFVLPYTLLLVLFAIGPALYALWLSFEKTTIGAPNKWGGLVNYAHVFHDVSFSIAAKDVGEFLLYWLPISVVLTVSLALILHARRGRLSDALRMIYFIPAAVTGSAAALLWLFMLDPSVSPIGWLIRAMGYDSLAAITQVGNLAVIFMVMALWTSTGFWIVVIYGALMDIPRHVIEAARIDGCGPFRLVIHIHLPLIRKYLLFMLVLSFAGGSQLFAEPSTLAGATLGGAANSWSLSQLAFSYAFQGADFGATSALSILLLATAMLATLVIVARSDFFGTVQ